MNKSTTAAWAGLVGAAALITLVSCGSDDGGNNGPLVAAAPQLTVAADGNRVAVQVWTQLEATAGAQITPHDEARGLGIANAVVPDVLNAIDHRYAAYAYVASTA